MCQQGAWSQARAEIASRLGITERRVAAAMTAAQQRRGARGALIYDGLTEAADALRGLRALLASYDTLFEEAVAIGEARERARQSALRETAPMMQIVS